jgi:hypothetical protein
LFPDSGRITGNLEVGRMKSEISDLIFPPPIFCPDRRPAGVLINAYGISARDDVGLHWAVRGRASAGPKPLPI